MELPAFLMDPIGDIFGSVEGIAFGIMAIIAIGGALGTVYSKPRRPFDALTHHVLFCGCWSVFAGQCRDACGDSDFGLFGQCDAGLCLRCDAISSSNHGGGF